MSNTPRTDANLISICYGDRISHRCAVKADFARELETELADARAEIERLKLVSQNQETVIAAQRRSAKAKNELIEQMREALKFSLIADEVRQTRNVCASDINDACETSRIKRIAALSAAERGEL